MELVHTEISQLSGTSCPASIPLTPKLQTALSFHFIRNQSLLEILITGRVIPEVCYWAAEALSQSILADCGWFWYPLVLSLLPLGLRNLWCSSDLQHWGPGVHGTRVLKWGVDSDPDAWKSRLFRTPKPRSPAQRLSLRALWRLKK